MARQAAQGSYARIYAVVRRIPPGRVATYGQVARLAGFPRHARRVGYALHALPGDSGVPWQRVINAKGEVSPRALPGWEGLQVRLLEREGVRFDGRGRVSLARYQWGGSGAEPRRKSGRLGRGRVLRLLAGRRWSLGRVVPVRLRSRPRPRRAHTTGPTP